MFSTFAVAVAVVLCVASVSASANFHAKMQSKAASAAAKAVSIKNTKQAKVTTSPTFVYTTFWNSSSTCSGDASFETVYGTNLCLPLSFSDNGASSVQYSWDATTDVLSALYYSDDACTTQTSTDTVMDFSGYTINSCNALGSQSGTFSTSTSYSLNPSAAGVIFSYAPTDAECTSNQFFESTYVNSAFNFDDDFSISFSCILSAFSGESDTNFYTAEAYMSYAVTSGSSSSSSSSSCFAGSETVLMESGEVKAISEVVVGDSILASDASGNTKFSNVVAVPHGSNTVNTEFVQLTVASGADIKMTPEHLVMVSKACVASESSLMAASAVENGMCLVSTSGMDAVEKVATVQGRGIYSVVTEEEFVVVNGFVASPFAVNHAVANAYYNIVRAIPSLMNFELVKKATNVFGSLVTAFSA